MFNRKSKNENKAKLEHKLYLARESPEPIFDISDCDLKAVPSGIYSLCKVFLKEQLLLHRNCLTSLNAGGSLKDLSLLRVLNLSYNSFTELPNDINQLINLKELYINDNHLKYLPVTIGQLKFLQLFDVSNNNLKYLPEEVGNLTNLIEVYLKSNKNLKQLPKTMYKLNNLKRLSLDSDNFLYPPDKVVRKGTVETIKYICEDVGTKYVDKNESNCLQKITEITGEVMGITTKSTMDSILDYENIKKKKIMEFLEIERQRNLLQRKEYDLAQSVKLDRKKLLSDLAEQQIEFENKLSKLQHEREIDKFRLLEQLQEAEDKTNIAVNQLLSLNREPLAKLLEQEKLEENRLLEAAKVQYENLEKNKILSDMKDILSEENEKLKKYGEFRKEMMKAVINEEFEIEKHLSTLLNNQELHKNELVKKLSEDQLLQKAAVGALLERSDSRSWALIQETKLIENQLMALTAIELDRKKLKMDQHLSDLADKRENLSYLLIELYQEQSRRKAELLSALNNIEEFNNDNSQDFWLKQYQQLLERMPNNLSQAQKNVDQRLAQRLLFAGVINYLPILMKLIQDKAIIKNITEEEIKNAGITNRTDCQKIVREIKLHLDNDFPILDLRPSAPSAEEAGAPTAPPADHISSDFLADCVVCMEFKCEIIFVPCGHYCCCTKCSNVILTCPLCRTDINQKVKVF